MTDPTRITIDNGVESDVDDENDYRCDECSTDTLEVFHAR